MKWGRFWAPAALVSAVLTAPAFWSALADGRLPVEVAALRFAIGLVVVAIGMSFVAGVVEGFERDNVRSAAVGQRRRATDVAGEERDRRLSDT